MTEKRKSIRVKIFGLEYPLRGDSEEFTRSIAHYVDSMIDVVHKQIPDQPPLTVSVLSALNITEDLFKERETAKNIKTLLEDELIKMTNYMDSYLPIQPAKDETSDENLDPDENK
ncbi:MAG: cell division protein ZapA [Bacteroidetes bacterium]|nr:cell division protein ZapA [Bacteroidota bacterium]